MLKKNGCYKTQKNLSIDFERFFYGFDNLDFA